MNKNNNSLISQKLIIEDNKAAGFVVFSKPTFEQQDWISILKLGAIGSKMNQLPLEYQLKRTMKGNVDEGRQLKSGKAVKLSLDADTYRVEIYTQKYGQSWLLSHTHTVNKTILDAYLLVVKSDAYVANAEKKAKSPENFSLKLG